MKKVLPIVVSSLLFWLAALPLVAQDEEAIKSVIAKETSAFMNVDYKGWADTWLKVPYTYRTYADATTVSHIEGWDELDKTFLEYFKTARPSNAEITNDWIEIKVFGNGAYARFTQKIKDNIDLEETLQMRVLEKSDGKWKIVCLGAIAKNVTNN